MYEIIKFIEEGVKQDYVGSFSNFERAHPKATVLRVSKCHSEQREESNIMKPLIKLHRYWQDENQSLSSATIIDDQNRPVFASLMMERGWQDNVKRISCIPKGTYTVKLEYSDRFKQDLWEIKDVPGRSETKFHAANYWYQLNGCIAPGIRPKFLDKDRYLDVTSSRTTLTDFHKALEPYKEVLLIITTEPNIF